MSAAVEIRPGASRQRPVQRPEPCRRQHIDPDPCYDEFVDERTRKEILAYMPPRGEVVHIPGCMGCAVYGHSRCTCTFETPELTALNDMAMGTAYLAATTAARFGDDA